MNKTTIMIPARMASGRLPGKPLLKAGGLALLHWVYLRALRVGAAGAVVAAPDEEIGRYCEDNGIPWEPTDGRTPTGTHRCAEVLEHCGGRWGADVVVNWQCDTLAEPADVRRLVGEVDAGSCKIATLVAPLEERDEKNPSVVKATVFEGGVNWFGRENMPLAEHHVGVYAFDVGTLRELGKLEPSAASRVASLEQLAWLEAGYRVRAVRTLEAPLSVNTAADFERFKRSVEGGCGIERDVLE